MMRVLILSCLTSPNISDSLFYSVSIMSLNQRVSAESRNLSLRDYREGDRVT